MTAAQPRAQSAGSQQVSLGARVRYRAATPGSGPHDVGFRLIVTLLFPKG
jgi:hypothetical protein